MQRALAAGVRLGRGALAWGWLGCSLLVLLCGLPWFELTASGLTFWLTVLAYALTLTGLGPYYFARRTQSQTWRRALLRLWQVAATSARWMLRLCLFNLAVTVAAFFVMGPYAFWIPLSEVAFLSRGTSGLNDQILFERDHQRLVQRAGRLVVLYPLVPGFNFVTYPAIEEIDSTWVATTCPPPALNCNPQQLALAQASLLAGSGHTSPDTAAERRAQAQHHAYLAAQQATRQRLGYDVVHFKLAKEFWPGNRHAWRQLREPLDSTHFGLARLGPTGALRFTTNQLTPGGDDALTLVVAQLKQPGTHRLHRFPADADASTMQLQRYAEGVITTFRSRPGEPPRIEITHFDPQQRIVEGTFAGRLYGPNGTIITVAEGGFSLRFAYLTPSTLPQ